MDEDMDNPRLSLSVLVTREEYSQAFSQQQRKEHSHRGLLFTITGAVLIILGLAGAFFGSYISLTLSSSFCLILPGVFMVCYDGFFAPLLDGAVAAREFDEKEDLHFATSYEFYDDKVSINNGRVEGTLPLSQITRWSETSALYTIAYGREISMAIPKRLMSAEQSGVLRELLERNAGSAKV